MELPHDSYVLVADGRKMLFFRNEGDADYPNLQVVTATEQKNPKTAEQGTDEPGRAFSSSGTMGGRTGGRSAYSDTDFHTLEETRFAEDAAAMLKERALGGEFEQLLIVAPPSTLGDLRKHYHKEVEKRLIGEIAKDLTNHPVDQIEKVIAES